ncbi:MAG: hypothetical protein HYW24_01510 [Candidatus Aenigmarchaeota archaeon]|nr:hypothetical protein [Candidatus Aenigmarchaeota archaeon]
MVNVFQIVAEKLVELGFYNFFLPFVLFSTVLYAMLRQTKVLGDSPTILGIVAISVGLFVFGLPVIIGVGVAPELTGFFGQMSVILIVFVFGLLIASFFYPNLMERLPDLVKGGGPLQFLVWAVVAFAALFGLFNFAGNFINFVVKTTSLQPDLLTITGVIMAVLIIFLLITIGGGRGG